MMLAFLFVVSGMTFPAFAATESTETTEGNLGDSLVALNVAIHGQVSLLFYFKNLDNVSYFKVVAPSRSGVSETKEVPKSSLKYDPTKDRYLLEVSIAAAQQTDTISVQAFDANNNGGKVRSYSVRNYADMVFALAEEEPDKYYYACEALKAMLNYGAMAQKYFGYNTENLANDGLYADGTNPVDGFTTANMINKKNWSATPTSTISFQSAGCSLDGKVAIKIHMGYTGNGTLKLTLGDGQGFEIEDIFYNDNDGCGDYALINGIPATKFDNLYTIEVTDGKETATGCFSVLNYADLSFAANPDLSAALYLYYVWVPLTSTIQQKAL